MPSSPQPLASGQITMATADAAYVYRAYCRCGDLLYVGLTCSVFTRLAAHVRSRVEWERRAARVEWDLYSTRQEAEIVEARWIREHDPIFNTAGRSRAHRQTRWNDLPWPTFREGGATPTERLHQRARAMSLGDRI